MPIDYTKYPPNWRELSALIRHERAQDQCECRGECGLHHTHPGPRRCVEINHTPAQWAKGRIVLTVAHLCQCDPLCGDPTHLKAMCQRCHNRVDNPMRQRHAAETRRKAKEDAGQEPLF